MSLSHDKSRDFQKTSESHSGEAYMGASMDWALTQLGFQIVHVGRFEDIHVDVDDDLHANADANADADADPYTFNASSSSNNNAVVNNNNHHDNLENHNNNHDYYHQIFYNGAGESHRIPSIYHRCRFRPIDFFDNALRASQEHGLHPKQILEPYAPKEYGTFMGYTIHWMAVMAEAAAARGDHVVDEPRQIDNSEKKQQEQEQQDNKNSNNSSSVLTQQQNHTKHGVLLGKDKMYFRNPTAQAVIHTLHEAGFWLHSTCGSCTRVFRGKVAIHTGLSPVQYHQLLRSAAFLIGFGHPVVSPSPLVALSVGTAFLNPVVDGGKTQHDPIAKLGPPYVYIYNSASVALEAAQKAVENPFRGFVPYEYRPEAMVARMCSVLEDNSVCTLPNLTGTTLETHY